MEDSGKFIVDGKEMDLDYDKDISLEILKELEKHSMTQLDAYYIRKRIHELAKIFNDISVQLTTRVIGVETRISTYLVDAGKCQAEIIPNIAAGGVHEIVNGKFATISKSLDDIKLDQKRVHDEMGISHTEIKKDLHAFNDALVKQINYVVSKTIFGWVKQSYEKKPLRTVFVSGVVGTICFLMIMSTLHVNSFPDLLKYIMGWFK